VVLPAVVRARRAHEYAQISNVKPQTFH
jgi:hypothetical protein